MTKSCSPETGQNSVRFLVRDGIREFRQCDAAMPRTTLMPVSKAAVVHLNAPGIVPHPTPAENGRIIERINEVHALVRKLADRFDDFKLPSQGLELAGPPSSEPEITTPQPVAGVSPEFDREAFVQPARTPSGKTDPQPSAQPLAGRAALAAGGPGQFEPFGSFASFPAGGGVGALVAAFTRNQESLIRGLEEVTALLQRQQTRIEALNREIATLESRMSNLRDGR